MAVELRWFALVDEFLAVAGAYLEAREAEHNLIFGVCSTLRRHPELYGRPWFIAVLDGERVVGAAMRAPPHEVLLSVMTEPVAVALADAITEQAPGVVGPAAIARAFAARRTGMPILEMNERIFKLERLIPPRPASGRWRLAEPRDIDLIAEWDTAFCDEARVPRSGDPRALAERWVKRIDKTLYLWEDGECVAMTGVGGETPHGIRIKTVYTPPARRGRGYASNLVAAATADQLANGRTFCFLFTDLANPTSNKIYQALGYEPVGDSDVYKLIGSR
jgi:predicted GNAT family acetyltransferase